MVCGRFWLRWGLLVSWRALVEGPGRATDRMAGRAPSAGPACRATRRSAASTAPRTISAPGPRVLFAFVASASRAETMATAWRERCASRSPTRAAYRARPPRAARCRTRRSATRRRASASAATRPRTARRAARYATSSGSNASHVSPTWTAPRPHRNVFAAPARSASRTRIVRRPRFSANPERYAAAPGAKATTIARRPRQSAIHAPSACNVSCRRTARARTHRCARTRHTRASNA